MLLSRKQDILACLEEGTEGCLTLVGPARIEKTVSAFVRLANSIVMNNTIEVRNEDYFIDLSYIIKLTFFTRGWFITLFYLTDFI